jgi:hypothetical protein
MATRRGGCALPSVSGGRREAGAKAQDRPPVVLGEGARMSHSGSPFEDKSGALLDGEAGPTCLAAGIKIKLINWAITKQTERRPVFSSENSNMADTATRGF